MTLAERYRNFETADLVAILENKAEYTPACIDVVIAELGGRQTDPEDLKSIARAIKEKQVEALFTGGNPANAFPAMPQSHFLDEEEIREMMQTGLENYMEKRDAMGFDVMKYSIGGGFI